MMGRATESIKLPLYTVEAIRAIAKARSVTLDEAAQFLVDAYKPSDALHGDVVAQLEQAMRENTVLEQQRDEARGAAQEAVLAEVERTTELRAAQAEVREFRRTIESVSNALGRALGVLWAPISRREDGA